MNGNIKKILMTALIAIVAVAILNRLPANIRGPILGA